MRPGKGMIAAAFVAALGAQACHEDEEVRPSISIVASDASYVEVPSATDAATIDGRDDIRGVLEDASDFDAGTHPDASSVRDVTGGEDTDDEPDGGSVAEDAAVVEDGAGDNGQVAPDDGGVPAEDVTEDTTLPDSGVVPAEDVTGDATLPDGGADEDGGVVPAEDVTGDATLPDGAVADAVTDLCDDPNHPNNIPPDKDVITVVNHILQLAALAAGEPTTPPDLIDAVRQQFASQLAADGYQIGASVDKLGKGGLELVDGNPCSQPDNFEKAMNQNGPKVQANGPNVLAGNRRLLMEVKTPAGKDGVAALEVVAGFHTSPTVDKVGLSARGVVIDPKQCDIFTSFPDGGETVFWQANDVQGMTVLGEGFDATWNTSNSTDATDLSSGGVANKDVCYTTGYKLAEGTFHAQAKKYTVVQP